MTMTFRQPQLVALFVHRRLSAKNSDNGVDLEAMTKDVAALMKTAKGTSGFAEYTGWRRDGAVTPKALFQRHSGPSGGSGNNNQSRGNGHYTPRAQQGGGRGASRQHSSGRGGGAGYAGRAAVCKRCSDQGLDANHGFRTCPQTKCNRCSQLGHIGTACPN